MVVSPEFILDYMPDPKVKILKGMPILISSYINRAIQINWIWDGVHPTVFGHELMAREWIRQVSNRLAFLKLYAK